jgi:hypothetical protein
MIFARANRVNVFHPLPIGRISVWDNRASHPVTYSTTVTPKRYGTMDSRNTAGLKSPLTEGLKSSVIQKFIACGFFHSGRGN